MDRVSMNRVSMNRISGIKNMLSMKPSSTMSLIQIVSLMIVIYYLLQVKNYLGGLTQCHCAPQSQVSILYQLERFYIFSLGLSVLLNIGIMFGSSGYSIRMMKLANMFLALLTLLAHFLFVYNVYEFYKRSQNYCSCVKEWRENVLYIQAFVYGIPVAIILMSVAMAAAM